MANDYFKFKRFTIRQSNCAMKVGTDGTLLGAWAEASSGPCRILDIGTGTGLIALMMAQRYPQASIVGVDIDASAVNQAKENVKASPFADRIAIFETDICHFIADQSFDAIVCNPPFFDDDLVCPENQRAIARHTITLSYRELLLSAFRLLSENGSFSVIIPTNNRSNFESEALLAGFFLLRICLVKTIPTKSPKRCLIELKKTAGPEIFNTCEVIEDSPGVRSAWYRQLTDDFYLR